MAHWIGKGVAFKKGLFSFLSFPKTRGLKSFLEQMVMMQGILCEGTRELHLAGDFWWLKTRPFSKHVLESRMAVASFGDARRDRKSVETFEL